MNAPLNVLDILAARINNEYAAANAAMRKGRRHAVKAGELLIEAKNGLPHGEWLPWLAASCPDISERSAQRYMDLARNKDWLTRKSDNLSDLTAHDAYSLLTERDERTPIRASTGGNDEWYTPVKYIDMAREVMGGIDLDPASCEFAQESVKAETFYTQEDNGLEQAWTGRVWLNPPYSKGLIDTFVTKLCEEYVVGNVDQAVVLTHNFTDTAWFHTLSSSATALCFTRGRIKFYTQEGQGGSPTSGHVFFYFGNRVDAFVEKFTSIGFCCIPQKEIASLADIEARRKLTAVE